MRKFRAVAQATGGEKSMGNSSGMLGGTIKKALPKIKEAMESGSAAPAAIKTRAGRTGLGGLLSGSSTATARGKAATDYFTKRPSPLGSIKKAMGNMRFNEGGMASDKAGRALGKKTADAKGRAMATTPMKKGGMAKKSSKK
jgi:hypothetical protein